MTASAETPPAEQKPAKATPKESPTASASDIDGAAASGEEAVSPWAWVILALLVLGLALGALLMMRSRRRRAWQSELAAAERDVSWLARDLVPTLRRTGSAEGAVGGWTVASARVIALEDRLTSLEGQAPDNAAGYRARSLRDAVRTAKARLDGLADAPTGTDPRPVLDEAVDVLEAALQPAEAVEPAGG